MQYSGSANIVRKRISSATPCVTLLCGLWLLSSCHWPDRVNGPEEPKAEIYETAKEKQGLNLTCDSATAHPPAKLSVIFTVTDTLNEPVTELTCRDFFLFEDSTRISTHESAFRVQNHPQDLHLSTLLLLDLSGSIAGSDFDSLKISTHSFIRNLFQNTKRSNLSMAIYWFDGAEQIHSLVSFTSDTSQLQNAVAGLNPGMSTDHATNLNGALVAGTKLIKNEVKKKRAGMMPHGALAIFTDGIDSAARVTPQEAQSAVDTCGPGVAVYTIGLGGEIDSTRLRAFGKNGFAFAGSIAHLQQNFEATATRIQSRLRNRYLLEYCTPKRNGRHTLTIKAHLPSKHELYGAITLSFPAQGFSGGCSLEGACPN